jgi:serine/threonine-protein kinase
MVSPISLGALVRHRYLIQQVLGQGGFGRTYLALDQERFNEQCVLKELFVPYQDKAQIEKSRTLFQREANILHQIQHPQIPRFWAAFEDDQRLFLVQDYIEGQTYRQLLSQRKQQGQTFSESEVLYVLSHMLPVLSYIHDRDIIHRDITLENIMVPIRAVPQPESPTVTETGLPVLIDFGAVKEAASHWPLTSGLTRVGKVGYAPPEQLQTGTVYPNSDLYALAASSLVLLTGREPKSLLDSQTLTWKWQTYTTIRDELGMILRKMLAVYPSDRYQSAREVWDDLQPLLSMPLEETELNHSSDAMTAMLPNPQASSSDRRALQDSAPPTPSDSFQPKQVPPSRNLVAPSRPLPRSQASKRSWTGVKIGAAATMIIALGIAAPIVWRNRMPPVEQTSEIWVSGAKLPQAEASRIIGNGANNSAIKPPNMKLPDGKEELLKLSKSPRQIRFSPGEISTMVQGTLQGNEIQPYVIQGEQGQIMTATLDGPAAVMNLLRSNQEGIDAAAYQTRSWAGQLPANDRYLIQISGSGAYSLDIALTPLSRPSQDYTQRVTFAQGTSGTTVTGKIAPSEIRRYLLEAKRGQILVVKLLDGKVTLSAIAPDGQRIGGNSGTARTWQGRAPLDGQYVIEVSTRQAINYALSFEVF